MTKRKCTASVCAFALCLVLLAGCTLNIDLPGNSSSGESLSLQSGSDGITEVLPGQRPPDFDSPTDSEDPISHEERWGYTHLDQSAEKNLYSQIYAAVLDCREGIKFSKDTTALMFEKAMNACLSDFPEFFHMSRGYTVYYKSTDKVKISAVEFQYASEGSSEQIAEIWQREKQQLEVKADELLSDIEKGASEWQIALYVHDALIRNCTYDQTFQAPHTSDAYGAVVLGKAVCEGYADAFQYLLNRADMECLFVAGTALDENGQSVLHAWNKVRIGGKFYNVDVTWDGVAAPAVSHRYFNLTDSQMQYDHVFAGSERENSTAPFNYFLPDARDESMNFYTVTGAVADDLAQLKNVAANAIVYGAEANYKCAEISVRNDLLDSAMENIVDFYNMKDILSRAAKRGAAGIKITTYTQRSGSNYTVVKLNFD